MTALDQPELSPIFIVGCPRSGTTLLRTIIASHSRLIIAPESHFLNYWVKEYGQLDLNKPEDLQSFWADFSKSQRFGYFQLNADDLLQKLKAQDEISFRAIFQLLLSEYAAARQKPRWGEKTPAHYDFLETLLDWFPQARVLWLVRDPRAVVASLLQVEWSSNYTYANAYYWLSSARLYREKWQQESRVMLLKYEDLVADPAAGTDKICAFLGEAVEPEMLTRRSEKDVPNLHAGGWAKRHLQQVMQPIGQGAVEKWRSQLSSTQIAIIEHITRDAMGFYGYEPITRKLSGWQKFYLGLSQKLDRAGDRWQTLRSRFSSGPSLAARRIGATPQAPSSSTPSSSTPSRSVATKRLNSRT